MASVASRNRSLVKLLTTPSKVANVLDWKKLKGSTILTLNIHKDRIELAVAAHPSLSLQEEAPTTLTALPDIHITNVKRLRDKAVSKQVHEQLAKIIKDYRVAGMVVAWPLQPYSGRMGAACGRVLYTLEQLLVSPPPSSQELDTASTSKATTSSSITKNRPLCLWNMSFLQETVPTVDEWGRSEAYSGTTGKKLHLASQEQYHTDEAMVAADVWNDFCKTHWPTIYNEQQKRQQQQRSRVTTNKRWHRNQKETDQQWVDDDFGTAHLERAMA